MYIYIHKHKQYIYCSWWSENWMHAANVQYNFKSTLLYLADRYSLRFPINWLWKSPKN